MKERGGMENILQECQEHQLQSGGGWERSERAKTKAKSYKSRAPTQDRRAGSGQALTVSVARQWQNMCPQAPTQSRHTPCAQNGSISERDGSKDRWKCPPLLHFLPRHTSLLWQVPHCASWAESNIYKGESLIRINSNVTWPAQNSISTKWQPFITQPPLVFLLAMPCLTPSSYWIM